MAQAKRQNRSKTSPARDREATQRALAAAAGEVLAEVGFQGFGVNAVARRAGCDKQLIYRYFGGIEGLIAAIGEDIAARLAHRLAPLTALGEAKTYREMVERMALGFMQVLRDDRLLQRIAAWEIADASPLVQTLTAARSKGMTQWVTAMRGTLKAPADVDAPALNAFVIAGVQHLVLAGSTAGQFAGLKLSSEKDWERARAAIKQVVALYGD